MRTFTLALSSRKETNQRFLQAFEGEAQGTRITFESPALLFSLLTAARWGLLKVLTGAGSISVSEAAQKLQGNIQTVHNDADALVNVGILRKNNNGEIEFPFEAVHVDFMFEVEAA